MNTSKIYKIGYIETTCLNDKERKKQRVLIEKDMQIYQPWVDLLLYKIEEYKQSKQTKRIFI